MTAQQQFVDHALGCERFAQGWFCTDCDRLNYDAAVEARVRAAERGAREAVAR